MSFGPSGTRPTAPVGECICVDGVNRNVSLAPLLNRLLFEENEYWKSPERMRRCTLL